MLDIGKADWLLDSLVAVSWGRAVLRKVFVPLLFAAVAAATAALLM